MQHYTKVGTLPLRVAVLDFLRNICVTDSEGYSSYIGDWSDKKVSKKFGSKISTAIVREMRREYFGKSRVHLERWQRNMQVASQRHAVKQDGTAALTTVAERLAAVEAELAQLRTDIVHLKSDLGVKY